MPVLKKTRGKHVRYYAVPKSDGKRRSHGGYASRAEAQAALDKLKVAKREGTYRAPVSLPAGTYVAEWIDSRKNLRPATRSRYHEVLAKHIAPVVGAVPITKMRVEHCQQVIDTAEANGLAPGTVHFVGRVLRGALAQAVRRKVIAFNPATSVNGLELPPVPKPKVNPPTAEQVETIVSASQRHPLHVPLTIMAKCGLRRSEALGLTRGAVDLDRRELRVFQTVEQIGKAVSLARPKTERGYRTVPLTDDVVRVLRDAKREQAERRLTVGAGWTDLDLVCDDGSGGLVRPARVSLYFRRLTTRLGIDQCRLHDLRHGVISGLLAGLEPLDVSRVAGHSRPSFTLDVYGHPTDSHADRVREAMGRAFAGS